MERGLKIPQSERTKTTNSILVSLMNQLEKVNFLFILFLFFGFCKIGSYFISSFIHVLFCEIRKLCIHTILYFSETRFDIINLLVYLDAPVLRLRLTIWLPVAKSQMCAKKMFWDPLCSRNYNMFLLPVMPIHCLFICFPLGCEMVVSLERTKMISFSIWCIVMPMNRVWIGNRL